MVLLSKGVVSRARLPVVGVARGWPARLLREGRQQHIATLFGRIGTISPQVEVVCSRGKTIFYSHPEIHIHRSMVAHLSGSIDKLSMPAV